MAQDPNYIQVFEGAKNRLAQLATRVTRAQVAMETQSRSYEEAVATAKANYGTSDLAEVRRIWAEHESANTTLATAFDQAVTAYEAFVIDMENALANPEAMAAMLARMPALEPVKPEAASAAATPVPAPAFATEDI